MTEVSIECPTCGRRFQIREKQLEGVYPVPEHDVSEGLRCLGSDYPAQVIERRLVT